MSETDWVSSTNLPQLDFLSWSISDVPQEKSLTGSEMIKYSCIRKLTKVFKFWIGSMRTGSATLHFSHNHGGGSCTFSTMPRFSSSHPSVQRHWVWDMSGGRKTSQPPPPPPQRFYLQVKLILLKTCAKPRCSAAGSVSSTHFRTRWYLCPQKSPYATPPPSLRNSPNVAFETVLMFVWLTMAISFFQIRLSSTSLSTPLSSRRSTVVTLLALCLQVVSQAPEHFIYSQKQATCEACFACQYICCYIFSFQPVSSVWKGLKKENVHRFWSEQLKKLSTKFFLFTFY